MNTTDYRYPIYARILHMGLAIFGIAAYLTAEAAEHSDDGFGYLLHAYLGFTVGAIILLRFIRGFTGSSDLRFSSWSPFSKTQWQQALTDIKGLLNLRLPENGMHRGIAGLVQAFGLMIFAWMSATGTLLFFLDEGSDGILFEAIEEAHEIGEGLIPVFLLLHVGAVIAHSLTGRPNWKRVWTFDN